MNVEDMNDEDILAEARRVLKEIEEEEYYYESGLFIKDFVESDEYRTYAAWQDFGGPPPRKFEQSFYKKLDLADKWLRERNPESLTRNKKINHHFDSRETGWGDNQAVLEWLYPKIPLFEKP